MTQLQTQTKEYWAAAHFTITESDIEQVYNHFLEIERPQAIEFITRVIIKHRLKEEKEKIKPLMADRIIYQPKKHFAVGDALVFPTMRFAHGQVTAVREANNPQFGKFQVIQVQLNGKGREFAADLDIEHPLNEADGLATLDLDGPDPEELYNLHGLHLNAIMAAELTKRDEFICMAEQWFVRGLMSEVNIGHLHLTEAILEMSEGGPLPTEKIHPHLDMDSQVTTEVQLFSLNHALLHDNRFDEVAPPGQVLWFLHRLEPDHVRQIPPRLTLRETSYDRALMGKQLRLLERELDDEWSDLEPLTTPREVTLTLTYPHRWAGTLPFSSRVRPLFPLGNTQRQIVTLIDEATEQALEVWVVAEGRYISGLSDWYEQNEIPVGAFITLTPDPNGVRLAVKRRPRPRREWLRLAIVEDGRLRFELEKRPIGCDYDDLLIIGTDQVAAIDALFQSSENQRRSLSALLAEVMPSLSEGSPQEAVHAKTLYSAVNLLRRVTPGALFAELVRHATFQAVGDQYWRFNAQKWQS